MQAFKSYNEEYRVFKWENESKSHENVGVVFISLPTIALEEVELSRFALLFEIITVLLQ